MSIYWDDCTANQSELVARYAKYFEVAYTALECIQRVVLRSRTSPRGDVGNEQNLIPVRRPVDRPFLVDVSDFVVVDCTIAASRMVAEDLASFFVVAGRQRSRCEKGKDGVNAAQRPRCRRPGSHVANSVFERPLRLPAADVFRRPKASDDSTQPL